MLAHPQGGLPPPPQPSPPPAPLPDPLAAVAAALRRMRRGTALRWACCALEVLLAAGLGLLVLWGFWRQWQPLSAPAPGTVGWAWWAGSLALALALGALVWRRTPTRAQLALRLEAREPALSGYLLAGVEALERPGQVPPAVAALSAECALPVLAALPASAWHPRPPWHAAHLAFLTSATLAVVAFAAFGPAFFDELVAALLLTPVASEADAGPERLASAADHGEAAADASVAGLRGLTVLVEPPAYTGERPRWLNSPPTVQAPVGARITVLAHAVPPGAYGAGRAELPGGAAAVLERLPDASDTAQFRLRFTAERSGVLRLDLARVQAERGALEALLPISVMGDQPPEAEATIAEDAAGTAGLAVQLRLQDDYGLTSARLVLRSLPADEDGPGLELPAEANFSLPLPAGRRTFAQRWVLPGEAAEAWAATGFQYRVEATDNAAPVAQTGRSPWKQYAPSRKGHPQAERAALLEPPTARRPRSLLRPNALASIPNPGLDDLAQLRDVGRGLEAPPQRQRSSAERLQDGPRQPGAGAGTTGPAPAAPNAGGKPSDTYDLPQGLGSERKPSPGRPEGGGSGRGPAGGGTSGGAQQEQPKDGPQPKGKAAPEGGAGGTSGAGKSGSEGTPGGEREKRPRGTPSGEQGKGPGETPNGDEEKGSDGPPSGDAGQGAEPGGGARSGESGPGGNRPRDGGPKTGREAGPGTPEMAPPDLETLARMKEVSLDEARRYAAESGLAGARTEFGQASAATPATVPGRRQRQVVGPLELREPAAVPGSAQASRQTAGLPAPQLRLEEIDPLYRALVEGYFRRLHEWRNP